MCEKILNLITRDQIENRPAKRTEDRTTRHICRKDNKEYFISWYKYNTKANTVSFNQELPQTFFPTIGTTEGISKDL